MTARHFLFFDVETTGLLRAKKNDIDFRKSEQFPFVVQISWELHRYEKDTYTNISSADYIIRPENYTITDESSKIHGITHQMAIEKGVLAKDVYKHFIADLIKQPDTILVCHNIEFDVTILFYHIYKMYKTEFSSFLNKKLPCVCTMLDSTEYCKLPVVSKYPNSTKPLKDPYKYPKLSELYIKLFGEEPKGQLHNSKYDVECTIECFKTLMNLGLLKIRYATLVVE
jgi:DNA polymerase III epsilon subunit-like protein